MNNYIDDDIYIYASECGDEIEAWEFVPKITAFCDACQEFHEYLLVE
jgi:hypothetical protein